MKRNRKVLPLRFALNEGILYAERPPISPSILVLWVVMPLGLLFLLWGLPGEIGARIAATLFLGIIFLIAIGTLVVPFVRHKEIFLTNNELHLRLGPFEDNISKYDIISVEPIGEAKPEYLFGEVWGPGGYGFRNLFLPLGVVTTKNAKWYVFGLR